VLLQKFLDYNFPPHITVWALAFLQDREQFVSIGNINSTILKSNPGPNDFKLLINDLQFDINYAKYVDDITMSSISIDPTDCSLQSATDLACTWSMKNGMHNNEKKTKEMLILLDQKLTEIQYLASLLMVKLLKRVSNFKLLGVVISSDLSWRYM